MPVLKLLALLTLVYWLYMLWDTYRARKLMLRLPHHRADGRNEEETLQAKAQAKVKAQAQTKPSGELPLVSVIIAAKEEEASIVETVKHLLNQTYPRIEIIAVNDRSKDATGSKLEELRQWSEGRQRIPFPLKIIHVTSLPSGWLGKNHALYQGYQQARGHYLLFTDADIRFQPAALADAVHYMREQQADHLALAPDILAHSFWLRSFVQYFFFTFSLYFRPWRANIDSQHKHGMGVGAFNMMTRRAYERIGTHRAFALRPDDDLQLGLRVKQAGLRQRLASGRDHIAVAWYSSLGEAIRGLEKNVFSGFQYRTELAALGVLGQLLFFLFPFAAVFLLSGLPFWLYAGAAVTLLAVYLQLTGFLIGRAGKEVIVLPVTICIMCYIVVRSVCLTLRQGGIYWRGTFYPLKELKKMKQSRYQE